MAQNLRQLFTSSKTAQLVRQFLILLTALLAVNLIAVNLVDVYYVLLVDLGLIIFWLSYHFFSAAFLAVVLLHPFVGYEFVAGGLNVPYGDLLATVVLAAWLLRTFLHWPQTRLNWKRDLPGVIFVGLFFISGALSIINAELPLTSLKYLLRPLIFFYMCFVVLPVNIIKDEKQLKRIYQAFFVLGIFTALIGLASFFLTTGGPWYTKRALPLPIFGMNIFGGNQNALAEVLTICIPFTLILLSLTKKIRLQGFYLVGLMLMSAILLLTFSRSGWIALLMEMIILFIFGFGAKIPKTFILPIITSIVLIPTIFYFSVWQQVAWVRESNENRLILTEISWDNFIEHPVIGNGLNSYRDLISQVFAYTVEFGEPLDSHGFVQKILVEQGLMGLISFVAFLIYIFYVYLKAFIAEKDRHERFYLVCLIMMLSGIVMFELFSTSYYIAKMWLPIGVGLAAIKLYKANDSRREYYDAQS